MIFSHDDQTIIAQCTPKGSGAVALLRLSGLAALEIASKISSLASGKTILDVPTHTIHYGWIINDNGARIDQVMFFVMHEPKTFTGQNTVEISCHNNQFIIESIIARAITCGARMAKEGEFTKRAVLNSKIDLVQAEAINELIHANTQVALKKSLAQLEGSFSHWITLLEKELIKAMAFSEASFEFIDEEMTFDLQIKEIINHALATIDMMKKTFDQQLHMRQGIRIAIIGSVNAGKSSLFNAILNKERAIVTEIAGTTRDVIEGGLYKFDNYWTVIDTAGLRQTNDIIEQEGIKKSHKEAELADIILLVFDGSRALSPEESEVYQKLVEKYCHKMIIIQNKSDLPAYLHGNNLTTSEIVKISSTDKAAIEKLIDTIQQKVTGLFNNIESPFLLNHRQFNLLLGLEKQLKEIEIMLNGIIAYEKLSYHINDALAHMSELTGKSISEQGMDAVFREFCVGK